MRRHTLRSGKSVSSTGHHMQGGSRTRDTCAQSAAVSRATSKSASSGRPSGLNTRYVTGTDTQCNDEPYKADSEGAVEGGSRTAMRSADIRQVPEGLLTEGPDSYAIGKHPTRFGGTTVSGCPAGHRFNSSPRHRSAMRVGVGEKDIHSNMVSGRGHRFTTPDGPADHGYPQDDL